jgi:hypothetical protein
MSDALPQPDLGRFGRLDPDTLVLARLAATKSGATASSLQKSLGSYLTPAAVEAAVRSLRASDRVTFAKAKIVATAEGLTWLRQTTGRPHPADWDKTRLYLAGLILGLPLTASKKADVLAGAVITVAYDLPMSIVTKPSEARSALIWRVLNARLGDLVGASDHPFVEATAVDKAILEGLSGRKASTIAGAMSGLAASLIGASKTDANGLSDQLVRLGATRAFRPEPRQPASNGRADPEFVQRVKAVAATLQTPPFHGRVAIGQVYDAYAARYPNAEPLPAFKERLVAAAGARALRLERLDLREGLADELRERSHTRWGTDSVHFVVSGSMV